MQVKKPHHAREVGLVRFVARELGAYALHGALGLVPRPASGARASHRSAGDPACEAIDDGATVLFVHGHGGASGAFALLERALRRRGHRRFAAWDYRSAGTLDDIAVRLARFARAAIGGEVHVVAHSLGGIVARLWLQDLDGREQARSLVTLSTPHGGVRRLPVATALPLVREVVRGSPLIERLERGVGALDSLPCLALVSSRDHFIRPWQRAGFGRARVVPISDAGHVGLLFSREAHRLVGEHIESV